MGCDGLLAVFTVQAQRVFFADVLDYQKLRRNVFVAFAGLFSDQAQILIAAVAVLFFLPQIVRDPLAFQLWRQGPPSTRAAFVFVLATAGGRARR